MKTRTKTRPTKTVKRQKTKMEAAANTGGRRIDALKRLLAKERADTLARVKELMREQARNGGQPPADEMDVARSPPQSPGSAQAFTEPVHDAVTKFRWRGSRSFRLRSTASIVRTKPTAKLAADSPE